MQLANCGGGVADFTGVLTFERNDDLAFGAGLMNFNARHIRQLLDQHLHLFRPGLHNEAADVKLFTHDGELIWLIDGTMLMLPLGQGAIQAPQPVQLAESISGRAMAPARK